MPIRNPYAGAPARWLKNDIQPDEMARYRAAARAFQELESSDVSPEARQALFGILENATEREGVRLWAARVQVPQNVL